MPLDREDTLKKAEKLLRQGRLDAAIAEYLRVTEDQPRDWNTANTLGDLYVRANQPSKAVDQYARIAEHFVQDGFYPKAAALYKKILKIAPGDEQAQLYLAEISVKQGLLVDAKSYFNAVAARRRSRGDRKGADEITVRLGAIDPADIQARVAAARVLALTGDETRAASSFRELYADLLGKDREAEALDMDPGIRSPLIDLFRRGEAGRDVRLLAAQGALSPSELDQVALLVLLSDDTDAEVSTSARATLDKLPLDALRAFLARGDVPSEIRGFFASRNILPAEGLASARDSDSDRANDEADEDAESEDDRQALSSLPIVERMKLAMKGTRSQRAQLIRDSNKIVAAAVLSSPKLTETEVEAFSKMANVAEEVLRAISMNRAWMKNYGVVTGLTRNPKTPPGISMHLVQRLNERDLKMLLTDRNVPEAVRLAAKKFLRKGPKDAS